MARAKQAKSAGEDTPDAITLLKADHRQVEDWFGQFEKARDAEKKQTLATQICNALKVHTMIEEEIFYPAFLEATEEKDIHHEAEVEHDCAKTPIAEIDATSPDDDYFDAKVSVLSEMIKHHVKEEEGPGGMFSKSRDSEMDLDMLGQQLAARKAELESESGGMDEPPSSRGKSRGGERRQHG